MRTGITKEDVFAACEKIIKKNETPTLDRIRAVLKTGSYSTIVKHFKSYKEYKEKSLPKMKKDKKNLYVQGYEDAIKKMKQMINEL